MPTGFVYVVTTVKSDYQQKDFSCVPTALDERLYFGPCKAPMRPRMEPGDWIFGVSPARTNPRRIVFAAEIQEVMTFADAHGRFPALRGPEGPIPVRPTNRLDPGYARSRYAPIAGSSHDGRWELDVASPALDRFFVCAEPDGFRNRWLGAGGPAIDPDVLTFFNRCFVFGQGADGTRRNAGTPSVPIALGRRCKGIHLETAQPERLLQLCQARVGETFTREKARSGNTRTTARGCGTAATVTSRTSRRC